MEVLPDEPSALTPGVNVKDLLNQLSLVLGLFLGVVGLPHVLIRLYTVKDAVAARKSTELTIISLAIFYTMTLFVGLAAMMLLYPLLTDLISQGEVGKATNTAVAELGDLLGGQVLLGIVLAGAMAAILSSAVGLLIQMTTTVAHDGYTVLLRPESSEEQRVMVARVRRHRAHGARRAAVDRAQGGERGAAGGHDLRHRREHLRTGAADDGVVDPLHQAGRDRHVHRGPHRVAAVHVRQVLGRRDHRGPAGAGEPGALRRAGRVRARASSSASLTKDVGAVDHFMHLAHDRDGRDSNGGTPVDA